LRKKSTIATVGVDDLGDLGSETFFSEFLKRSLVLYETRSKAVVGREHRCTVTKRMDEITDRGYSKHFDRVYGDKEFLSQHIWLDKLNRSACLDQLGMTAFLPKRVY